MENEILNERENFIERMANHLQQNATVKNVFGEPVVAGGKTIIPVAQVALGYGGGFGRGNKMARQDNAGPGSGEGAGGGGGMYARPKGVYEVTDTCRRFIPVNSTRQILLAAFAGFMFRAIFWSRRKR